MKRVKKQTLFAMVKRDGTVNVRVVPCAMYPGSMYSFDITLIWNDDRGVCVDGATTCEIVGKDQNGYAVYDHMPMLFDTWYNNWSYYNTNSECGYYAHYYVNA